jgi:hypothetical protein
LESKVICVRFGSPVVSSGSRMDELADAIQHSLSQPIEILERRVVVNFEN